MPRSAEECGAWPGSAALLGPGKPRPGAVGGGGSALLRGTAAGGRAFRGGQGFSSPHSLGKRGDGAGFNIKQTQQASPRRAIGVSE